VFCFPLSLVISFHLSLLLMRSEASVCYLIRCLRVYVVCFQDLHSSAWFMFISSSRAFALWLDITCLVYIGLVTFSFLFFDRGNSIQFPCINNDSWTSRRIFLFLSHSV
jgi:hypothetical protein